MVECHQQVSLVSSPVRQDCDDQVVDSLSRWNMIVAQLVVVIMCKHLLIDQRWSYFLWVKIFPFITHMS